MIILKNGTEILFSYKKFYSLSSAVDWLFSKLYENQENYFYLSLTLFGGSVTIQKR